MHLLSRDVICETNNGQFVMVLCCSIEIGGARFFFFFLFFFFFGVCVGVGGETNRNVIQRRQMCIWGPMFYIIV